MDIPCHAQKTSASINQSTLIQQNSAVVIDGMAVVNEIIKDKSMKTCKVSRFPHSSVIVFYRSNMCFITENLYHNLVFQDTGNLLFTPSNHYFSFSL